MKPLVSILIPAYNAEKWVGETICSAMAQTWPRKEIIVINDGSTDQTGDIVRRLASKEVKLVSTDNQGLAAARNHAFRLSQGDYIQWLDADDLLAPDKIERQIVALPENGKGRTLLSSAWAFFYFRTHNARFLPTSLWQDLSPVEWLLRKMGENLHMPNSTWLTSRALAEAAGPEDTRLHFDQDGEYFCRVLLASQGTLFVPEARAFYRLASGSRVSHIGTSKKKKESLLFTLSLHIGYLRSLEESARVRRACINYLQTWYKYVYPESPDLVSQMQDLAAQLQGHLEVPRLRWKYAWIRPIFGWQAAKRAQVAFPQLKASLLRQWDRAMYMLEGGSAAGN